MAQPSQRTRPPSRRLTASALIASSAARLAAAAVVSAWSYGGETSTMSIPARSTAADDLADGAEDLAGQHAAGLGGAGAGRHARIDDVDVEREVDRIGAVERLGDGVGDDRLGSPFLDLAHEVPAHALLLHPGEGLGRRPVAAQADLDEVLAADRARFDQPAHRRAVAGEHAPGVVGGVGVGVEMDDADAARAAHLGDGGGRRPGDRMVAAEDDRDGAGPRDLEDLAVDHRVAALDPRRDDVGVAGVDDRRAPRTAATSSASEWIEPEVYCASRMARGPKRAPDRWVTASSNGAPTMATSTAACAERPRGRSSTAGS